MRISIQRKFYFIALLITCFLASCTPSTENEKKKWNINTNTISELKTSFPSFVSFLQTDFDKMQSRWTESENMTDEEKKAEEMNQINAFFYSGYVQDLFSVKSKLEDIEEKKEKINGLKMTDAKWEKAEAEIKKANEKVESVKEFLSQPINDQVTAEKLAKEANSELIGVISALNSVIKNSKKKKKK